LYLSCNKICKKKVISFKKKKVTETTLIPILLPLLLSEACPDHNFFVFPDRSIIFGMWVHDHKMVCRIP
jgi:hypothetical protein